MKTSQLSNHVSQWFSSSGPNADIVISSRIRLARNVTGYPFSNSLNTSQKKELLETLKDAVMSTALGPEAFFIDVDALSQIDKDLLVERHLISTQHAGAKGPRGVVVNANESFTAMINEEDHLRMQVYNTGLQLKECWETINQIDDQIEKKVNYCFSDNYGYLTACPTNLGTGIRVSVMLHLPALRLTGQIDKFFNAARDTDMAVRGLFGEGTEAIGDFFQLSNQITLGLSEQQIVDQFSKQIVPKIIEYEAVARNELLEKQQNLLDDKIQRALGVLKSARMISSKEALFLLSHVRMGVNLKRISEISINTVNELFMLTQPAHLQLNNGSSLSPDDRDTKRAEIIRSKLCLN
jgi:protein arginine kinase